MNEFRVGDWWLLDVRGVKEYYITGVAGDKIKISTPRAATMGVWITASDMALLDATFLGHGRPKWYWRFLPWRDLVCPYYLPQ